MPQNTGKRTLKPEDSSRVLPQMLNAIAGRECNLWFNSLPIPNTLDLCEIRVKCDQGRQLGKRWTWVPRQPGSHLLSLALRDRVTGWSLEENTVIQVRQASFSGETLRYLAIGDSITAAGHYLPMIKKLFHKIGVNVALLGTQTAPADPACRHEGYPGWKYADFLTQRQETSPANSRTSARSPFLYNGALSFSHYLADIGATPDVVTVFLGANDLALIDEGFDRAINQIVAHAGKFLLALAGGFPGARIGVILPLPPAPTQDAFGNNYGCLIPRWLYLRNACLFRKKMALLLETLPEQIQCVPAHLQFDADTAYPIGKRKRHASSTKTEAVFSNALHPTAEGHSQIAESLFAWMLEVQ